MSFLTSEKKVKDQTKISSLFMKFYRYGISSQASGDGTTTLRSEPVERQIVCCKQRSISFYLKPKTPIDFHQPGDYIGSIVIEPSLYNLNSSKERYRVYLQSDHWQEIKRKYRSSRLPQDCHVCGTREDINLHHRTYKRRGKEYLRDLLPLCTKCHKLTHAYIKSKKVGLWAAARVLKSKLKLRHRHIRRMRKDKYKVIATERRDKMYKSYGLHLRSW